MVAYSCLTLNFEHGTLNERFGSMFNAKTAL